MCVFVFFNDTATTEIYTLSLHDALPISVREFRRGPRGRRMARGDFQRAALAGGAARDRKSTRLNSSHLGISYAVFCLKKKKRYVYLPPPVQQLHIILDRRLVQ